MSFLKRGCITFAMNLQILRSALLTASTSASQLWRATRELWGQTLWH